jgi:hypothetical protein
VSLHLKSGLQNHHRCSLELCGVDSCKIESLQHVLTHNVELAGAAPADDTLQHTCAAVRRTALTITLQAVRGSRSVSWCPPRPQVPEVATMRVNTPHPATPRQMLKLMIYPFMHPDCCPQAQPCLPYSICSTTGTASNFACGPPPSKL